MRLVLIGVNLGGVGGVVGYVTVLYALVIYTRFQVWYFKSFLVVGGRRMLIEITL